MPRNYDESRGSITGRYPNADEIRGTLRPTRKVKKGRTPPKKPPRQPAAPTRPIDPYAQEIEAAARLRYGGQRADLQNAFAQNVTQQQQATGWFDQYIANVDKQKTAQDAFYQGQLAGQQQAQQQAVAGAPLQGPVTPEQAQTSANAASVRGADVQRTTDLIKALQGIEGTYLTNRQGVGSAAQLATRLALQNVAGQLGKEQRELGAEEGAFKVQYGAEARERGRKAGLEERHQKVEEAAFGAELEAAGAKAKTERAKVRTERAKERTRKMEADRRFRLDKAKFGVDQAKDNYQRRHGLGSYKTPAAKGESPADRNRIVRVREKSNKSLTRLEDARADWDRFKGMTVEAGGKKRKPTPSEIKSRLRDEGYSAAEIHLMLMDRAGKQWGQKEIEMAHRLGIRVPRLRLRRPKSRYEARIERNEVAGPARPPGV